jgi:hypothetical protein
VILFLIVIAATLIMIRPEIEEALDGLREARRRRRIRRAAHKECADIDEEYTRFLHRR